MASRFADINSVEHFIQDQMQENDNTRKKLNRMLIYLRNF